MIPGVLRSAAVSMPTAPPPIMAAGHPMSCNRMNEIKINLIYFSMFSSKVFINTA
jgi:hypothetical protein